MGPLKNMGEAGMPVDVQPVTQSNSATSHQASLLKIDKLLRTRLTRLNSIREFIKRFQNRVRVGLEWIMDGQVTTASNLRGHKRPASDHLENEQRLTKRFNLLNLCEILNAYLLRKQAIDCLLQIKPINCLMLRGIIYTT